VGYVDARASDGHDRNVRDNRRGHCNGPAESADARHCDELERRSVEVGRPEHPGHRNDWLGCLRCLGCVRCVRRIWYVRCVNVADVPVDHREVGEGAVDQVRSTVTATCLSWNEKACPRQQREQALCYRRGSRISAIRSATSDQCALSTAFVAALADALAAD